MQSQSPASPPPPPCRFGHPRHCARLPWPFSNLPPTTLLPVGLGDRTSSVCAYLPVWFIVYALLARAHTLVELANDGGAEAYDAAPFAHSHHCHIRLHLTAKHTLILCRFAALVPSSLAQLRPLGRIPCPREAWSHPCPPLCLCTTTKTLCRGSFVETIFKMSLSFEAL